MKSEYSKIAKRMGVVVVLKTDMLDKYSKNIPFFKIKYTVGISLHIIAVYQDEICTLFIYYNLTTLT